MMRAPVWLAILGGCASRAAAPPTPPRNADAERPPAAPADVVLLVDLSKSMMTTDLAPDRLEATKLALRRFVADDARDRIRLIVFAIEAREVTAAPLDAAIAHLQIGDVPELGTAIGDGLGLAVDALSSSAACKVVVLVADGDNNYVVRETPEQATARAKAAGVVVHTVLVGSDPSTSNPAALEDTAAITGGTFHRAIDADSYQRAMRDVADAISRPCAPAPARRR
jgi:Ca-activated chloride channel family protein